MIYYAVFITLCSFVISAVECQRTCVVKDGNYINVSCDVTGLHAPNITWSLFDTELKKTLILNLCETTTCHPFIPRLADTNFLASVTADDHGLYVQSSSLIAQVKYANLTKLTMLRHLECRYNDHVITLCDSFDVYVNPTKLTIDEISIGRQGSEFVIAAETDTMFPAPKCTLYVDDIPVENNSTFLLINETGLMYKGLFINPESDDRFDYVNTYTGICIYELNVTEMGRGTHQLQLKASAKTNDPGRNVVSTDAMAVNFDLPEAVVPVCNYPEVVNRDITLTCRSDVLSNIVGCEFQTLTNGTSSKLSYDKSYTSLYASLLGAPKLVVECKTKFNTTYLGPGYHEFRVSVVTNGTKGNVNKFPSQYTTPIILSPGYVPGCNYNEVSDQVVVVSCRDQLTSHVVGCEYEIKTNGNLTQVKGNISLDHARFHGESVRISECNLTVSPRDLGLGYHQFRVTMTTNDTSGNVIRIPYNWTSPLLFDLPVVYSQPDSLNNYNTEGSGKWTCDLKTPGHPPGSVRWTWVMSNGTLFTGKPGHNELTYTYQSLVENKNFSCQPLSVLKDDLPKLEVNLVVNQNQKLLNFTANGKERQLVVDIGSYVTLACHASGYPVPRITFRHVGRNVTMVSKSPYYTFNVSSCLDAGRYVCGVKQWSSYKTLESQIEIIVKCPQIIRSDINVPTQFYTNVKGNLEVTIPVSGYPEPSNYILMRQSGNQTEILNSGYKASYRWGDNPNGTVVLSFSDVQDNVFTNYTLVFGNGLARNEEFSFSIVEVAETSEPSSDNVGAIVGAVCGGVAGVVLIVVIIYFINRSQKHGNSPSRISNNYALRYNG